MTVVLAWGMIHMIGKIIQQRRQEMGMTRQNLAQDICSEKYVYMIENDQRTPSVDIVNKFNQKLMINLFEYYELLGFDDPTSVKFFSEQFVFQRRRGDIQSLFKMTSEAKECKDYTKEPLCHEIIAIDLETQYYENNGYDQIIHNIQESYFGEQKLNIMDITLSRLYKLTSMCYLKLGKIKQAQEYYNEGYALIKDLRTFKKYQEPFHSYMIYQLELLYFEKKHRKIIEQTEKIIGYQETINSYDRIYYPYYYAAFAYFEMQNYEKSRMLFVKASYAIILHNSLFDYQQIKECEHFNKIIDALEIPLTLKAELRAFDSRIKL